MIQSLGPMTTLLCFLEAPPNYCNKFETATVNALAHIPNIDGIIRALNGALIYYPEFTNTIFAQNPTVLYETAKITIVEIISQIDNRFI